MFSEPLLWVWVHIFLQQTICLMATRSYATMMFLFGAYELCWLTQDRFYCSSKSSVCTIHRILRLYINDTLGWTILCCVRLSCALWVSNSISMANIISLLLYKLKNQNVPWYCILRTIAFKIVRFFYSFVVIISIKNQLEMRLKLGLNSLEWIFHLQRTQAQFPALRLAARNCLWLHLRGPASSSDIWRSPGPFCMRQIHRQISKASAVESIPLCPSLWDTGW